MRALDSRFTYGESHVDSDAATHVFPQLPILFTCRAPSLINSPYHTMPYQFRDRATPSAGQKPGRDSSVTQPLEEHERQATEPTVQGSGTNRRKRGLSCSSEKGHGEISIIIDVCADLNQICQTLSLRCQLNKPCAVCQTTSPLR